MISAHYGISDVFDNLVISLCKFTTLLSSAEVMCNFLLTPVIRSLRRILVNVDIRVCTMHDVVYQLG